MDNILGLFEKLESQSLAVQPSRCVVVRNRNASCRRCADSAVSIDAKPYTYTTLSVNQSVAIMSETLLVMVLPVALIVIGIVIWYRRRRA